MKRAARRDTFTDTQRDTSADSLALVQRVPRVCPRCGRRLTRRAAVAVFCSRDCGKADSAERWRKASGAVYRRLVEGVMTGLYRADEIGNVDRIADTLRWAGRTSDGRRRRNEVMRLFGLEWDAQERAWKRSD